MTAYEVLAANKWFFQHLVVDATSQVEAAAKFRAYLATPEALAHEQYEAEQVSGMDDTTDPETLVRENYAYGFDLDHVEEFEGASRWHGEPTADVQRINSGGNG